MRISGNEILMHVLIFSNILFYDNLTRTHTHNAFIYADGFSVLLRFSTCSYINNSFLPSLCCPLFYFVFPLWYLSPLFVAKLKICFASMNKSMCEIHIYGTATKRHNHTKFRIILRQVNMVYRFVFLSKYSKWSWTFIVSNLSDICPV